MYGGWGGGLIPQHSSCGREDPEQLRTDWRFNRLTACLIYQSTPTQDCLPQGEDVWPNRNHPQSSTHCPLAGRKGRGGSGGTEDLCGPILTSPSAGYYVIHASEHTWLPEGASAIITVVIAVGKGLLYTVFSHVPHIKSNVCPQTNRSHHLTQQIAKFIMQILPFLLPPQRLESEMAIKQPSISH